MPSLVGVRRPPSTQANVSSPRRHHRFTSLWAEGDSGAMRRSPNLLMHSATSDPRSTAQFGPLPRSELSDEASHQWLPLPRLSIPSLHPNIAASVCQSTSHTHLCRRIPDLFPSRLILHVRRLNQIPQIF